MRKARRGGFACLLAATAVGLLLPVVAAADSHAVNPTKWPVGPGTSPQLSATAHSIRFFGADRFQTNLAAALALRGKGGFPFDTADRSSGGAPTLDEANNWWGAGLCPRGVIVVAGDVFTDALSATSLSDPTGQAPGARLERVAAADPAFDPPGGIASVDLTAAPILVTPSARQGFNGLGQAAVFAAKDLSEGGCTTARSAVIVGGTSAVPKGAENDLLALGYTQVFRVAGTDRFDTAARVATALRTGSPTNATSCTASITSDDAVRMGFYGPGAVELRPNPSTCRVLGRTVVLADGGTGADALAAGWWTSFWQVPLLYTNADGSLPAATVQSLQVLGIEHLIVLGGTARIPQSTVDTAITLTTGAEVIRVSGVDRYDTSVQMARFFGGWWGTGNGSSFHHSMVCLAASGGNGGASVGWPDALSAGPLCAAMNGAAGNPMPPIRALPPTDGPVPLVTNNDLGHPGHAAVPVLLVAPGSTSLPDVTTAFLREAFVPGDAWCSSEGAVPACVSPGFAVALGGTASVTAAAEFGAARLVSGERYSSLDDRNPSATNAFVTSLDLSPIFADASGPGRKICIARGGLSQVRWLAEFGPDGSFDRETDVMTKRAYAPDVTINAGSPGTSAPLCAPLGRPTGTLSVEGVGISGAMSPVLAVNLNTSHALSLSGPIRNAAPSSTSGEPSQSVVGGMTTWTFVGPPIGPITATSRDVAASVKDSALTVTLTRGASKSPSRFSGALVVNTTAGSISAGVAGEAQFDGQRWILVGMTTLSGGTWNVQSGEGGFRAEIAVNGLGSADDAIAWQLDGLVS